MLILWRGDELTYGGVATTWDPTPTDREAMRDAARAVGETLRRCVEYRGAFSLDGVMTADGFRPTEINTRLSIGLGVQVGDIDDIPLGALARHLRVHPDAEIDTGVLERRIVSKADSQRSSRGLFTARKPLEPEEIQLTYTNGSVVEDSEGLITLEAGPALFGGIVFVNAQPGVVTPGSSFAPVMAACAPFVESWLDVEIGELDFATDVRTI